MANTKIKILRGLKKDLPLLDRGEIAFCTDTEELFAGDGEKNLLLSLSKEQFDELYKATEAQEIVDKEVVVPGSATDNSGIPFTKEILENITISVTQHDAFGDLDILVDGVPQETYITWEDRGGYFYLNVDYPNVTQFNWVFVYEDGEYTWWGHSLRTVQGDIYDTAMLGSTTFLISVNVPFSIDRQFVLLDETYKKNEVDTKFGGLSDRLDTLETSKQDKLVAGDNITIDENNEISAIGGKEFHRVRIFNSDNELITTQILYDGEKVMKPIIEGFLYYYNTWDAFKYNDNITEDIDLTHSTMIPPRYVQTTVEDFDENGNYTGTESYIILPADKPDGYKIVNPYVLGVATNGDYLTSCENMFNGNPSSSLELDYLDTSNVTNMSHMFAYSQATTLDLSSFDTSNVTNINYMFRESQATELDLSNFDTSKVTSMVGMFENSQATELDLSSFDTSNVTDMGGMFYLSQATTLDLSNFDTSNVTNMYGMFYGSQATTLDLSNFDTSNVTNMYGMFGYSEATTLDLSNFDTSNVTSMRGMFYGSQATTLDLSSFDTSNVTEMRYMFYRSAATTGYARTQADADNFNNSEGKPSTLTFEFNPLLKYVQTTIEDFDSNGDYTGTEEYIILPENKTSGYRILNPNVKGVATNGDYLTSCENMFRGNPSSSLELDYLDTSNVTNMSYMFSDSKATTLDLSSFDTSNVTTMSSMFALSSATTFDLSSFDTSNVTHMNEMFAVSPATTLDLSSFDTSNVTNMNNMFVESQATTGYARTQTDADNFNNSLGKPSTLEFVVK
jgi:surface protein